MNLSKIGKWAVARAKEGSTWTGLAIVAAAIGGPKLGMQIGQVGQIVGAIAGSGLVAASTTAATPAA